jgi:hypothetical protein
MSWDWQGRQLSYWSLQAKQAYGTQWGQKNSEIVFEFSNYCPFMRHFQYFQSSTHQTLSIFSLINWSIMKIPLQLEKYFGHTGCRTSVLFSCNHGETCNRQQFLLTQSQKPNKSSLHFSSLAKIFRTLIEVVTPLIVAN